MWLLYQFPLCPFSRKLRFLMAEKGITYDLARESPWAPHDEFLDLNPAGTTPVLVDQAAGATLIDSQAACEYFEETVEQFPLISGSALARAEIRRLVAWLDQIVYRDVVAPLLHERMMKRIVHRASPDAGALRDAMRKANTHMDYLDYLLDHRSWLGSRRTTFSLRSSTAANAWSSGSAARRSGRRLATSRSSAVHMSAD